MVRSLLRIIQKQSERVWKRQWRTVNFSERVLDVYPQKVCSHKSCYSEFANICHLEQTKKRYSDSIKSHDSSVVKRKTGGSSINSLTIVQEMLITRSDESANIINNDLLQISKWSYNWKMLFDPDPERPAQEVLFSRKNKVQVHPTINYNNTQVERRSYQKHLGILLDEKLNFKQHIDCYPKNKQRYICNKKTRAFFTTEIITCNI